MKNIKPAVWFPTIKANTGVDRFTINLVEALNQRGIQAEITWLPHHAEYLPWITPQISPPKWANIIHINSWLHPKFYQNLNLPVVTTCHGCVHDKNLVPYKNIYQRVYHQFWVKKQERLAFQNSKAITAVSTYTAKKTKEAFGDYTIRVIPNWINYDAFLSPKSRSLHKPFRLLFLGRLSTRKGTDLLPKIMKDLGNDFFLNYTSYSNDEDFNLSKLNNTKSLGWSSDINTIRKWIDESDALIFPSRMEGMPLAVLEAMARGLPIISSDCASLPEIIKHEVNGILCSTKEINTFIDAAKYLSKNPRHWGNIAINAFQFTQKNFNQEKALALYIETYKQLLHTT